MKLKKLLTIFTTICLLLLNTITVKAVIGVEISVAFRQGYNSSQGKVQISFDGESWTDIDDDFTSIFPAAASMLMRVVPAEFYEVNFDADYAPNLAYGSTNIFYGAGGMEEERAILTGSGVDINISEVTAVALTGVSFKETTAKRTSTMSISIESEDGSDLEYWKADIPSRVTFMLPGTEDIEFGQDNLTWKDDIEPALNVYAKGVSTTNNINVEYDYDNSGSVEFLYHISNASTKVTSLIINGFDYANNYCPKTDEEILANIADGARSTRDISFKIPYATHYDVKIVAAFHDLMGGFGWNYLDESHGEDAIPHGTLSFVSGEYDGVTYNSESEWNQATINGAHLFAWVDGDKYYTDEHDAWGSAAFPKGAKITMKLIPDEGYQLTSLYGDENIVPEKEVGVYTITMKGGMNSHLMATFEETEDVVNNTSTAVSSGSIDVENTEGMGTMRLDVEDSEATANMTSYSEQNNLEINDVLDIKLYNTVNKAGVDGSWDKEANNLDNPAKITLQLSENYDANNLVIIHEHNGVCETIVPQYDSETNSITFDADKFSDYAIASTEKPHLDVKTDGNGTVTPSEWPVTVNEGDSFEPIVITPNEGYVIDGITAEGATEDEDYWIGISGWPEAMIVLEKMPANNVTFRITFAEAVTVTFDANGGTPGELWRDTMHIKKGQAETFDAYDELIIAPEGMTFDGVEIDGEVYGPDDEYILDKNVTVKYLWREKRPDKDYEIPSTNDKFELDFTAEDGDDFTLMVFDIMNLSDEELAILDATQEEVDAVVEIVEDGLKDHKDILGIYLIELINNTRDIFPPGPFTFKIKLNSKLKEYENLKLIDGGDILENPDYKPETVLDAKVEGDYLVITLENLDSNFWVLSGKKKSNEPYRIPVTGID